MARLDRTGGLFPLWAPSNRPMLTLLLVLVGMCGKGSGKYMEGEMVTGDNWIFMARLTHTFKSLVLSFILTAAPL